MSWQKIAYVGELWNRYFQELHNNLTVTSGQILKGLKAFPSYNVIITNTACRELNGSIHCFGKKIENVKQRIFNY